MNLTVELNAVVFDVWVLPNSRVIGSGLYKSFVIDAVLKELQ